MTELTRYGVLAAHYDALMAHIDYDAWASYTLRRLGLPQRAPQEGITLVDLGCGTGTFSVLLARRGYDVVGVDASEEMLAVAQQKADEAGVSLRLYHQSITDVVLDAPVDGVLAMCDTFNYLTEDGALTQALARVAELLRPGARGVFDMHTELRLQEIGSETYADDLDDVAYIWQSEYDPQHKVCTMYLTLFEAVGEALYRRYDEVHVERAYSSDEVEEAVGKAGLVLEGVYGDLSDVPPSLDERRVFYVVRRSR